MIAPIRKQPVSRQMESTDPRHIGQLLPALLARYGIVISETELATLSSSRPERGLFVFVKQTVPRGPSKISSGPVRRRPLRTTASAHCKMVQLPLFAKMDSGGQHFCGPLIVGLVLNYEILVRVFLETQLNLRPRLRLSEPSC